MKKIAFTFLLLSSLYSFKTKGSYWTTGEVWFYSNLPNSTHNQWVYDQGIWHWDNRNYLLGPANITFFYTGSPGTGIVEVEKDPSPRENVPGETHTYISNCREIYDGKIYINYQHFNWTQGKFATVIRHEIGHAVGLADEPDNPDAIMYPFLPNQIPEYKQVIQDDINGLGCLYGGDFNWGNETLLLLKPKGYTTYACKIPIMFGGCDGQGTLYDVTIYVKYDVENPNSPWIPVITFPDARGGCEYIFYGRHSSSLATQVKAEWVRPDGSKDSTISGIFTYIWNPVMCPDAPRDYQASGCGCKFLNILEGPIPIVFKKLKSLTSQEGKFYLQIKIAENYL